jgi:beta-xylosidase
MLKSHSLFLLVVISLVVSFPICRAQQRGSNAITPKVYYSDSSRLGRPFAKDPSIVKFHNKFWMYYSLPPHPDVKSTKGLEEHGWSIGIAESKDLFHWKKVGEIAPTEPVEMHGIAAPGARVIRNQIHLFYQTYGGGSRDAICHAVSTDGIHFTHDPKNPVYRPTQMAWSVGRAIDAEVFLDPEKGKAYLYFATRNPAMKRQMIGMAQADLNSNFSAGDWHDVSITNPLLAPQLPWEQLCIEAPTVVKVGSTFYMFYAGAYNNSPQQIGVAQSKDAIHWTRVFDHPFLANGPSGSWNSSESGHPGVLQDGQHTYLFYQGNSDGGKTYWISMVRILWSHGKPHWQEP